MVDDEAGAARLGPVAMRDFAQDWLIAKATAEFPCAECGRLAARVALLVDQPTAVTGSGAAQWLIAESGFFGDWWNEVSTPWAEVAAAAIDRADASALYAIDPLWAPFYCPECAATFCNQHWQMRLVFDDEWPDWYDYTDGTCPHGHTRMVDD
jgi:hypothetical protein